MFKKSICGVIVLIICILSLGVAIGETHVPEKIRIGLYFSDPTKNIYKSASSVNLNAENGLDIGITSTNDFNPLLSIGYKDGIVVKKDLGLYHIQIEDSYSSLQGAQDVVASLIAKGVDAYPAYNGRWFVVTGFYASEEEALEDVVLEIGEKLLLASLKVIKSSNENVLITDSDGDITALIYPAGGYVQVKASKNNSLNIISVNGTFYRGDIEIRRKSTSDMTVINIVDFEEYLYGVLPGEMQSSAHIEALKAQAVAARTFAVKEYNKFSHVGFNLCSSNSSQVYKGYSVETESTNKAVNETKGKIVTYNDQPASTFYFSSSGGMTENVENVWGSSLPYLQSVEDKYEKGNSWNYNWITRYAAESIRNILIGRNEDIGQITGVYINELTDTGRVTELLVAGTKGEQIYKNSACRTVLNDLNSQMFNVKTNANIRAISAGNNVNAVSVNKKVVTAVGTTDINDLSDVLTIDANNAIKTISVVPTEYIFEGKGWGHAVGMSQEGAKGMADNGYTYDEILKHYYTGVEVE